MVALGQRSHHYERALEEHFRALRVPYVSVNEARKALMPDGARLTVGDGRESLKSFDYVVYGEGENLLVEVKGRKVASREGAGRRVASRSRLECWVTQEDVESLLAWERLFGPGFRGVFAFVYWCTAEPASSLFEEMFEHRGRWYALRAIGVREYAASMRTRSPRWRTVHLPASAFEELSRPLVGVGGAA